MKSLVSLIVPIYNVENYLSRCVDSILNQSYENIEIILVDDGSTDNSEKIANIYEKQYNKIKVIHKFNGGLSDARNCGLDYAKGEYVCFIDADDYVHSDFVTTLVKICEKHDCEIAQCSFRYTTKSVEESTVDDADVVIYSNLQMLDQLYNETYVNTVVAWNKMYRKELFDSIRYPVGRIHEDEATTYKLLYQAKRIGITKRELYYYFQNPYSIMHQKYSIKRLDILYAIEERREFYFDKGLMDLFYKDNYRYLTKILVNYYQISHISKKENSIDTNKLLSQLKYKYIEILRESKLANWSLKRRLMLSFFRFIPGLYVPLIRPDQK